MWGRCLEAMNEALRFISILLWHNLTPKSIKMEEYHFGLFVMVLHHIVYIDHLVILGGCHRSQTDLIFMQFHHHSHQVFPAEKG